MLRKLFDKILEVSRSFKKRDRYSEQEPHSYQCELPIVSYKREGDKKWRRAEGIFDIPNTQQIKGYFRICSQLDHTATLEGIYDPELNEYIHDHPNDPHITSLFIHNLGSININIMNIKHTFFSNELFIVGMFDMISITSSSGDPETHNKERNIGVYGRIDQLIVSNQVNVKDLRLPYYGIKELRVGNRANIIDMEGLIKRSEDNEKEPFIILNNPGI